MPSLKTDVVSTFINTFTSILMPVVTFPYATRVFGIGRYRHYQLSGFRIQLHRIDYRARHTYVRSEGSGTVTAMTFESEIYAYLKLPL